MEGGPGSGLAGIDGAGFLPAYVVVYSIFEESRSISHTIEAGHVCLVLAEKEFVDLVAIEPPLAKLAVIYHDYLVRSREEGFVAVVSPGPGIPKPNSGNDMKN